MSAGHPTQRDPTSAAPGPHTRSAQSGQGRSSNNGPTAPHVRVGRRRSDPVLDARGLGVPKVVHSALSLSWRRRGNTYRVFVASLQGPSTCTRSDSVHPAYVKDSPRGPLTARLLFRGRQRKATLAVARLVIHNLSCHSALPRSRAHLPLPVGARPAHPLIVELGATCRNHADAPHAAAHRTTPARTTWAAPPRHSCASPSSRTQPAE